MPHCEVLDTDACRDLVVNYAVTNGGQCRPENDRDKLHVGPNISAETQLIHGLIREDEKRRAEHRLESLLLDGLESKESRFIRKDLDDIRKQALVQLRRRRKTR